MSRFSSALLLAAASATALAPVAAQAAPAQIERSSEKADGENLRGGYLLPLAIIIAIILGVVLLSGGNKDNPVSS
jgi:hypothetical protein